MTKEEASESIRPVKKLVLMLTAFLSLQLYAVAPESSAIGTVAVAVGQGTITEIALEAVREEYTEEWLGKYTEDPIVSGEILSPYLSHVLPLTNPIAGLEKNSSVEILDLDGGEKVALIFHEGKIKAAYSEVPELPEL